jgi:hypothetical protein
MDFGDLLPPRPVEDVLAERVRLVIGGETFDLPVLTIAENRAWKERSDLALGMFVATISLTDDLSKALDAFDGYDDTLMDLLLSYDTTGALPSRDEIEEGLTPLGLFRAVSEVWRAARPLADITRTGMSSTSGPERSGWRLRIRSWLRSTAGPRGTSSVS